MRYLYSIVHALPGYIFRSPLSISRLALCALLLTATIVDVRGESAAKPHFDTNSPQPALEAIRVAHELPGLGAAIVTDEGLQMLSTTGVRRKGDATQVTDQDLWHLGSCGKAITATMIARLVEAGKLRFEQTLGETFPELDGKMSDQMKKITLVNLLSHTSGLPANFNLLNYVEEKNVARARRKVLREAIDTELQSNPGEKFSYSNWGYTLAGHMAEKATGKSWETLMKLEVFKPLKMSTAGFGGTGTPGKTDQPWPHIGSGVPTPANGKEMDNLPVMGPAGTIHMSLEDWGKFVTEHLKGHQGKSDYLTQASFQKLHTVVKDNYALGWMSAPRPWAGGSALNHGGDNTMNHAVVWAAPQKGFAVLVVTNQSMASQATDDVASGFIRAWTGGGQASMSNLPVEYAKLAPYSAVRWEQQQPFVKIDKQWHELVSLNDVPVTEIVAFCEKTYGGRWQKRFEEDLVEVLTRMKQPPEEIVKLELQAMNSKKTQVMKAVAMTAANRAAIKSGAGKPAIDAKHRSRLVGRYQLAPNFVFDVNDRDGRLMVGITNQPTQEVFPDSPTHWSYRSVDATLEFKLAKSGAAKSLVLHQNGMKQAARRIK